MSVSNKASKHKKSTVTEKSKAGRVCARLAASIGNTMMVLYVYTVYLANVSWSEFGRSRGLEPGQSRSVRDYFPSNMEPAFVQLQTLTFSESMLTNIPVYLMVGFPVMVTLIVLERSRVRWLKEMFAQCLPQEDALRAQKHLDAYHTSFSIMLCFTMLIAFFHLGWPIMHYICAGCGIGLGGLSALLYLSVPVDLEHLTQDAQAKAWASQTKKVVRPVLKTVLLLHVLALAAGIWKGERLGDDLPALVFGVFETALIVSYQVFQGIFVFDDMMMCRQSFSGTAPTTPSKKISSPLSKLDDRMLGS